MNAKPCTHISPSISYLLSSPCRYHLVTVQGLARANTPSLTKGKHAKCVCSGCSVAREPEHRGHRAQAAQGAPSLSIQMGLSMPRVHRALHGPLGIDCTPY